MPFPRNNMEALAQSFATRGYDSEWHAFIHAIQWLGIPFSSHHGGLEKKEWQKIISDGGYTITSFACHYVQLGDEQYVFATGKALWTVDPADPENADKQVGHGPSSPLLLIRNAKTGEVKYRTYNPEGPDTRYSHPGTLTGAKALARQYGCEDVLTSPGYLWYTNRKKKA